MNFSLSKDDEHKLDSIGLEEVMAQFRANTQSTKTSAFRGVSYNRNDKKWIPRICAVHGRVNLPSVIKESEAALSYDRAAIAFGRPEAELNFPGRRAESESLIDDKLLMKLFGTTDKYQIQALVMQDQQHRQGSKKVKGWNKSFQAVQTQRNQGTSPRGPSHPSAVCPRPSGVQHTIHDSSRCRQQQMGASEVVDLSGADDAGGMQQVSQHKAGPVAQGIRPLTEAVQHKGGPVAQGMRPSTEAVQHKGGPVAQGMRPLTEAVQHKGGPVAQGMRPLTEAVQHKAGPVAQGMRPLTQVSQHKAGPVAQGMRPLTEAVQHKGGPVAQGMRPLTEAVQHKGGPVAQGMRPLTEAVQHNGGPGAQGMRPLTEAVQHKGGPGAQGMRPLTEVERVQMIRLGQQKKHQQLLAHQQGGKPFVKGMILVDKEAQAKANYDQMIRNDVHYQQHKQHKQQLQQQQSLVEIEKMGRAKMQKQAIIWDRSSQQELHPYAEPHAPQSSIPGLPNMFMQMPAYNGVETSAQPSPTGPSSQHQGIKRNREGGYDSLTPGGEGPGGPLVSDQKHLSSRVGGHARQADEGGHMTAGADTKRLRQDEMGEAAAYVGLLPSDVHVSYKEEAQGGKVSPLDRQSEGGAVGGRMMDMGSLALVPPGSSPLASVSPPSSNDGYSTEGTIRYIGDDNDLVFMLLKAVRLAHTSAVGQGLVGACTFAMCRRSFLTWMAGTPMAQLSEQGTDLEQINGIERRLLRYTDDAAYCLDLLSILGFSWSSGEREVPTSKSAWH